MTKLEKETVILFNEAEQRLKEEGDGGVFWRVPKKLIQVRALWDEQRREAARQRLISFSADKVPIETVE